MFTSKSKMERGVQNVARSIGIDPKVASKAWKNVSDTYSKNRLMKRSNSEKMLDTKLRRNPSSHGGVMINMSNSPPNMPQSQPANISKYALICLTFFAFIFLGNYVFTKHLNQRTQPAYKSPSTHYFEHATHTDSVRRNNHTFFANTPHRSPHSDASSPNTEINQIDSIDHEDPTLEEKSFKSLRENQIDPADPATATKIVTEEPIMSDRESVMELQPHKYEPYPLGLSHPQNGIYYLAMIADMDKASKHSRYSWRSYLQHVKLTMAADKNIEIEWIFPPFEYDEDATKISANTSRIAIDGYFNEGGRGMELSELVVFDGRMYAFDDRTGIIYEISKQFEAIPRHIAMEGNGDISKGMKIEWSTYKEDEDLLYFGSIGREYTNGNGTKIRKLDLMYICTLDKEGRLRHIDWTERYIKIREVTATLFPGYLWIEAIEWSNIHRKWFIVPRYVSFEKYDSILTESRGCNLLIIASEDFSDIELVWIRFEKGHKKVKNDVVDRIDRNLLMVQRNGYKSLSDLSAEELRSMSVKQENMKTDMQYSNKGFSSIRFLPNTNDTIIVGVRTQERDTEVVNSFLSVFDIDGNVYLQSKKIPGRKKYEGLVVL